METTTEKKIIKIDGVVVDKSMRDYSNEPAFVRKLEEDWEWIKKHGLPFGLDERITPEED